MARVNNPIANQYVPSKSSAFMDLTGQRFGRWLVVERAPIRGRTVWLCRCDCGTEKTVAAPSLREGLSRSCGCILKTHGGRKTRLYRILHNMLNRCRNPNNPAFNNYGGRGISVCDAWVDYRNFQEWAYAHGYTDDLTIERIDVNGDYEPSNCTWISLSEQAVNRRTARRDDSGKPWLLIAKTNGIGSNDFNRRVRRGWGEADAATIPLGSTRHLPRAARPLNHHAGSAKIQSKF